MQKGEDHVVQTDEEKLATLLHNFHSTALVFTEAACPHTINGDFGKGREELSLTMSCSGTPQEIEVAFPVESDRGGPLSSPQHNPMTKCQDQGIYPVIRGKSPKPP